LQVQRGHWLLLVLFVFSLVAAGAASLGPSLGEAWLGKPWPMNLAIAGAVAAISLVLWWLVTGFYGYEHRVGLRIVRRSSAEAPRMRVAWGALAVAMVGVLAMHYGLRSAGVAIVVALAVGCAIVVVLIRHFALFATLSIMGIAIGVAALIVVQSVATGFQHEFERRVLGVYAHINVTRSFGISEYRRFEEYLRSVPGVEGASPFVYLGMALAPTNQSTDSGKAVRRASVLVKGIEPSTADQVIELEDHLRSGSDRHVEITELSSNVELQPMPDRDDARLPPVIAATVDPRGEDWYSEAMKRWRTLPDHLKHGRTRVAGLEEDEDVWPDALDLEADAADLGDLPTIFVGVSLARELELDVDDIVMLVDPSASFDHTEPPEFRRYRIAGVFRAGFQEYDTRLVYVHIAELQWFKYRGKDIVSGIDLRLTDPYDAPEVEAVLRETIGNDEYSILEWQKLNANLFQSIRTQKSILTVILCLVSVVAGFNVLAALWTMVVRRTAETAIMMSMGATESGVARIFQFSGMMLGVVGCVAGVVFGLVLCWLVQLYGYTLDPEVYFIERLPVELSLVQIAAVVALTLFIAFVATLPPALRAAKLRPVEGLRYE
jgi:lipoprotein-releasing system permease protein